MNEIFVRIHKVVVRHIFQIFLTLVDDSHGHFTNVRLPPPNAPGMVSVRFRLVEAWSSSFYAAT